MEGPAFVPTHTVPPQGASWWSQPDPARPADGRLDAHLPVQVLTVTTGWARVRCSNGWETWVDARSLLAHGAAPQYGTPATGGALRAATADPAAIGLGAAGGVLAVLAGFLPWFSGGGVSVNAWDLPAKSLLDPDNVEQGLDTGVLLLIGLAALVPLLTRAPLPAPAAGLLGAWVLVVGLLALRLYADSPSPKPSLGIGIFATLLAGGLLVAAAIRAGTSRT